MTPYDAGASGPGTSAVFETVEYKAAPRWLSMTCLAIAMIALGMGIYYLVTSFSFLINMLSMQAKITPEFRRVTNEQIYTLFGKSVLLAVSSIGSAIFFAIFSIRVLRNPGGRFQIGQGGFHVDGVTPGGKVSNLIGWNEIEKAGDTKLWSGLFDSKSFPTTFVGVKLRDPEAFLDKALASVPIVQTLTAPLARIGQQPLTKFLSLFGISIPAPGDDRSYFRWMREQTGYDLLLPKAQMKDPSATLSLLQSLIAGAAIEAETVRHAGDKKCPMCAEYVKAEAKICRFCHYTFVS